MKHHWTIDKVRTLLREPTLRPIICDLIDYMISYYVTNYPTYLGFTEYNGTFVYVYTIHGFMHIKVGDNIISTKLPVTAVHGMAYRNGRLFIELDYKIPLYNNVLIQLMPAAMKLKGTAKVIHINIYENDTGKHHYAAMPNGEVALVRTIEGFDHIEIYNHTRHRKANLDLTSLPPNNVYASHGVLDPITYATTITFYSYYPPAELTDYVSTVCANDKTYHLYKNGDVVISPGYLRQFLLTGVAEL